MKPQRYQIKVRIPRGQRFGIGVGEQSVGEGRWISTGGGSEMKGFREDLFCELLRPPLPPLKRGARTAKRLNLAVAFQGFICIL